MIDWSARLPAEQLAQVMARIYERRLTSPSGGNLSLRAADGSLWVTPSQIDKATLTSADMVRISVSGRAEGRHQPTMEYRFHQGIYAVRPELGAVTHAHPAALVAFSLIPEHHDLTILPVLSARFRPVGYASYALPGSAALGEAISGTFSKGFHAVFMENHGVITAGLTPHQAFYDLENMEHVARICIQAARIGRPRQLPAGAYALAASLDEYAWPAADFKALHEREQKIAAELIYYSQRSYDRTLFTATSGCFSRRLGDDDFLITPEAADWLAAEPGDISRLSGGSLCHGQQPSRYATLHRLIYRQQPHIMAIATAHPASLMAYAVTGETLAAHAIPEGYLLLREVPDFSYKVLYLHSELIAAALDKEHCAALLQQEAVVITGSSLFQVFDRLEVAENTAASLIDVRLLGVPRMLDRKEMEQLRRAFDS